MCLEGAMRKFRYDKDSGCTMGERTWLSLREPAMITVVGRIAVKVA